MFTPRSDGRLDPMAELLRADVADQVVGAVRVAVLMAVEAGDAQARVLAPPVRRRVELLLGKRRQQQAQPLELLRVQDPVEEAVEVVGRDELALRDVTQIRPGRQVDRGRELGQEPVGNVEVEIEAGQVPARLLLSLGDLEQREDHPALGVILVGQRHEAGGYSPLSRISSGVILARASQVVPAGKLDADAVLDRLPRLMVTPAAGRSPRS